MEYNNINQMLINNLYDKIEHLEQRVEDEKMIIKQSTLNEGEFIYFIKRHEKKGYYDTFEDALLAKWILMVLPDSSSDIDMSLIHSNIKDLINNSFKTN